MSLTFFLLFSAVLFATSYSEKSAKSDLVSGGVYHILSKVDHTALTVDSRSIESVPVFNRALNGSGTSGQKWRIHKAMLGSSFKLSPTSNEKAVLDLDKNTLSIWGKIKAAGNQKYWNLNNMGEGVIQIQNWQVPNLCLTSLGLDNETSVAECQNGGGQQWEFILL